MHSHKSAADIQRDIDLMRQMYDRREPLNYKRRLTPTQQEEVVVYLFLAVALFVPFIAAIVFYLAN
jgi:hypothetical protein